jgi:hypothetical protein
VEHIIGYVPGMRSPLPAQCDTELAEIILADVERIDQAIPPLHPLDIIPGHHIDCWLDARRPGFGECSVHGFRLGETPYGWITTNRFMSYCRLGKISVSSFV